MEMEIANWNKELGCDSIFIPCPCELRFMSSSALRELHSHGIDLHSKYIPEELRLSYDRWKTSVIPKRNIYFGKIGIGKSTYLSKLSSDGRTIGDCDKLIWQFFSKEEKQEIKVKLAKSITNFNFEKYNEIIEDMSVEIKWHDLFNQDFVDYEASALGVWFKYIPTDILTQYNVVELHVDDNIREKRIAKRGLTPQEVRAFDFFYERPSFVDNTIGIN